MRVLRAALDKWPAYNVVDDQDAYHDAAERAARGEPTPAPVAVAYTLAARADPRYGAPRLRTLSADGPDHLILRTIRPEGGTP